MTNFLDIRRADVQAFLWQHLVPSDIRWDYTRLDAMRHVQDEVNAGRQWLIGDMGAGLMFRVVVRSPKVVEPHIMGNAGALRSVLPDALKFGWERGVERVVIWTHIPRIISICERLGFTANGCIPKLHWNGVESEDIYVCSLERPA